MLEFNCTVTVDKGNGEGKGYKEPEIINSVFNEEWSEIKYKTSNTIKTYNGTELIKTALDTDGTINDAFKDCNVYFIFSHDKKRLLYVGKAMNAKKRLAEHLISCSASTNSHINDAVQYLSKIEEKDLKLYYTAIKISEPQFYGAVEGMLINYITSHSEDPRFKEIWNKRHD